LIEPHNTNPIKTKPRRWFRFRLRTLLVMVTLLSVLLGWVGRELDQRRGQKSAIAWVEGMGGHVNFFHSFSPDERNWWEKTKEKWFGERVRDVFLWEIKVSDLSPLKELKNLEKLYLSYTKVVDLSPLSELKNLEQLFLGDTQVSDLSPLAELKKLEMLFLGNTQLTDLSPLVELYHLEELDLNNTQVSDLSPLAELKNLESLRLTGIKVSAEQVEELRLALPNCTIVF
jgi:hypothetical protein